MMHIQTSAWREGGTLRFDGAVGVDRWFQEMGLLGLSPKDTRVFLDGVDVTDRSVEFDQGKGTCVLMSDPIALDENYEIRKEVRTGQVVVLLPQPMAHYRYLTFEIGHTCGLSQLHTKCPVSDPERFAHGHQTEPISDDLVLMFWRWARARGFRGTVLWHLYNEPWQEKERITKLLAAMRAEAPNQESHLWTGVGSGQARKDEIGVNHVVWTNYAIVQPQDLDNRRAAMTGEGDYARARRAGACGRAKGFELIIDHYGNWLKCCSDWRCEESVGNVLVDDWNGLLASYEGARAVAWQSAEEFAQLPRLCRACITENPMLSQTAMVPPGRAAWSQEETR